MKALTGLLWGLGGMALGGVLFAAGAALVAHLTNASNREGAIGYFVIALGIVGGLLGLLAGLGWYARSAPPGQGWQQLGQALLGLAVFAVLLVALGWAWVQSHELPVKYEGEALANLELEFRLPAAAAPAGPARQWLAVEVTTRKTRPVALVLQDQRREEGGQLVLPAVQGPLVGAWQRLVVARLELPEGPRDVVFMPRMPRKPDPLAGWSDWEPPREVFDPRAGAAASAPALQLRWRVRRYGD
jgi:MFS family permease